MTAIAPPTETVTQTRPEDSKFELPGVPMRVIATMADHEPARVGRYRLLGRIGQGAMGTVYRAADPDLEREVAVKLVRGRATAEARSRLLREARALARFSHPNIIAVFDIGIEDGLMYVVMEYQPGRSLYQWLADEPRDWRVVLDVFVQAGRGLVALHSVGLGHRDFKPQNVLLGEDGVPRVLDFGLAKAFVDIDSVPLGLVAGDTTESPSTEITADGTVVGTPAYMAPELWCKQRAQEGSDQFSFCVALYEGLFGRRPFVGNELRELGRNIVQGHILPPPPRSEVPASLWAVLLRGMARTPRQRYPSMYTLLRDLERIRLRESLSGSTMQPPVWEVEEPR